VFTHPQLPAVGPGEVDDLAACELSFKTRRASLSLFPRFVRQRGVPALEEVHHLTPLRLPMPKLEELAAPAEDLLASLAFWPVA